MPYYFIIALQAYCIYHLFKNSNENYWFFVILFLPLIGSVIYLILRVFNKNYIDQVQNEITTIINPTKKINDLKNLLLYSETFENRTNLAKAYFEIGDYENAIIHYEKSLDGNFKDDSHIIEQIIKSNFHLDNFNEVILYSEKISHQSDFNKSRTPFIYGLALEKFERFSEAEIELRKIDQRYSFYEERLTLAKFLVKRKKVEDAKEILNEILIESQHLTKQNKRDNNRFFIEAEKLKSEF